MFRAFSCGPRGRGWEQWGGFDAGAFGFGMGGGRGGPRRARVFGHGDLRYVVLQMLAEKPRHGYEIIKELEERFGGMYSPSPGTVYPTLSLLEDLGYARAREEEGGKKVYEITEEGRRFLAENRDTVDDIFDRVQDFAADFFSAEKMGIARSLGDLGRASFRAAARRGDHAQRVREILERAAKEIEDLRRE